MRYVLNWDILERIALDLVHKAILILRGLFRPFDDTVHVGLLLLAGIGDLGERQWSVGARPVGLLLATAAPA